MAELEIGSSENLHTQVRRLHARERRRSLAGLPELSRTHRFFDAVGGAMAVETITTAASFGSRAGPVTFQSAIRITENGGEHRGIVFEIGGTTNGIALWVGDQTIGFHAGAAGTTNGATALFDNGSELPPGMEIDLVVSAIPGTGKVRMWGNGREIARAQASGLIFSPMVWSGSGNGSFATMLKDTLVSDVPVESAITPTGFEVIEPLSVYQKQVPRHFV